MSSTARTSNADALPAHMGGEPDFIGQHSRCAAHTDGRGDVFEVFRARNWVAFWILGMINNFHYCLVLSAADDIATSFGLKSYVAMVSWANVFFGIVVRLLNAFVFAHVPYNRRYLLAGGQTVIGIVLVSCAKFLGSNDWFRFFVALLGVVCCGNGSTYGESVSLGYMEQFPSSTIGGWSSGTGMSGVLSSLIYLGLVAAGLSNSAIFALSSPLVLVYWSVYFFALRVPDSSGQPSSNWRRAAKIEACSASDPAEDATTTSSVSLQLQQGVAGGAAASEGVLSEDAHLLDGSASSGCESSWWCVSRLLSAAGCRTMALRLESWKRRHWKATRELHSITFSNNINLLIVYVAEYAVQFMAPFSFPCEMVKHSSNFWIANSFVITQFCYQIGVLCSRSSLLCIRVRRVWILSVAQTLNAAFWFAQAKLQFVADSNSEDREVKFAFVLFAYMIFVGLFGGASYVNVFYNILETEVSSSVSEAEKKNNDDAGNLDRTEGLTRSQRRQLSMNIGALYAIAGISLGSFVDLIFSNVVLTASC